MLATQGNAAKAHTDDVVTANSLATHLGMTRQNVARLTAEAVIEQRSDGRYDQTASRLRYIKHLRAEHQRSPRTQADADHVKIKTEMLKLRLLESQRGLVRREDELIDAIAGTVLTHLSGWGARCSRNLVVRRNIDAVVLEVRRRRELSEVCSQMADERGERRSRSRADLAVSSFRSAR